MTVTEAATPTRPFEIFDVRVARTARVTSHLVRITFAGEELADFADCGYDQRIKLILPPRRGSLDAMPRGADWFVQWRSLPDERQPPIRTYTVRAVRAAQREIDVDLVDHGDLGPASAFGRSAARGDRVMVLGPSARHGGPYGGLEFRADLADQTDLLLVGDDTAAPAICSILERLPPQARGLVCLEVEHPDAVQDIVAPAGVRVEWRVLQGDRGVAQTAVVREWLDAHPLVGTGADGATTIIDDGEESGYWEVTTDRGEGVPPLAAWIAGESSVVRAMRRVLVQEYQIPRSAVAFMGYWRQGFSEC